MNKMKTFLMQSGVQVIDMLSKKELNIIATKKLVSIFGRKYLRENWEKSVVGRAMPDDETFQLFVGIKSSKDLPNKEATPRGWVVYGNILVDAKSGCIKKIEYATET